MQAYLFPIETALVVFPILAVALTVPYVLYNYHRYGSVSLMRSILFFSFIFYLLCAYFLVILPLPDPATVAAKKGPFTQLTPFTFVREFFQYTSLNLARPSTYLKALAEPVVTQPVFNLLLTLPFGVYLSYYFGKNLKKTLLYTFLLSLFFEVTQLTGLYGVYARPYRLFDVDDLMLNTAGGALGYLMGVHLPKILPSRRRIDEQSRLRSAQVGYLRRFVAACIDVPLCMGLSLLLGILLGADSPLRTPAAFFLYFVGLQILTGGRTPGKLFVRIRVSSADGSKPFWLRLLMRYGLLYGVVLCFELARNLPMQTLWLWAILSVLLLAGMAYLFFNWLSSFSRGKRLWYEQLSGTLNTSTIPQQAQPHKTIRHTDTRHTARNPSGH